ncbi:MAG TPA: carboxylesterase family protein [Gemmataceae bacterium]|nr:carboxylesterase family protein [Gemmataceae bacterium]
MTRDQRRISRRTRVGFLGAAAALGVALAASATSLASASGGQPVAPLAAVRSQSLLVTTDKGQVEGRTTGTVDEWLGLPYAQPPVGALRWAPPKPAASWTGVRSALPYGSRCAQLASGNGPRIDNENCLYANVYAPSVIATGKKLPVLFMIHGGGLLNGAGDQYDGSLLVQSDDIIVVTINYRLGPFGLLNLPGLSRSEPAGNFSLLDMEAALRWTKANIAAFGGDPSQVTIAGESAGGLAVCSLLASPPAKGLFDRAIMESGSCRSNSEATAQAESLAFAKAAGCPTAATAAACLRGKGVASLVSASANYVPIFYTYGGADMPIPPLRAIASGRFNRVPILMGDNHDEGRLFTQGYAHDTREQYAQFVTTSFGSLAPKVLARYPLSAYPSPYRAAYAIGALLTDSWLYGGIGGCGAQEVASSLGKSTPVYFYQFDDRHAPGPNRSLPGYQFGAAHSMELAYLWPSFTNGYSLSAEFTPAQQELSRQMVAYWGAFTKSGSPDASGQPRWPAYPASAGADARLMSLRPGDQTRTITAATYGAEHQCSFWDSTPQPRS